MTLRFNFEDLRVFLRIPQSRCSYYSTDTIRTYMPTASEDHSISVLNAFKGALNDTAEGDSSVNNPGVRQLPLDGASGKLPLEVAENLLPRDERYAGPISWTQFRERAGWWEQIYIQAMREKKERADPTLCRVCQKRRIVRSGKFADEISISYRSFGTWAQLLCRSKCMICRLIVLSLSSGLVPLRLHPYLARVDPELQGTQLVPLTLPSGETCMAVEYSLRRIGVMRIVTQENFQETLRQAFQFSGTSATEFLGRRQSPFHDQTDQTISINQIKTWVQVCEKEHSQTCDSIILSSGVDTEYSILLIDVSQRCLVRSTTASRYLALSYVWGKVKTPETMRNNLETRLKPSGLPPGLPQTIEDAIILTGKMQEKYLWVDALCIVQDDTDTKHSSIQSMDKIYSKALATIVCLHGQDANAGLPGVRPASRKPQNIETRYSSNVPLQPDPDWIRAYDGLAKSDRQKHEWLTVCRTVSTEMENWNNAMDYVVSAQEKDSEEAANTSENTKASEKLPSEGILAIVFHPPPLKYALETSTWHHRGWTFQERLISKRGIYFSSEYVYFQCGRHTQCEAGGNIVTWSDVTTSPESGNATELIRSQQTNPLLHFRLPPPQNSIEFLPQEEPNPFDDNGILAKQDFDVYKDVIEMYTKKQLSYSVDILNALAGILAVVRNRIGGELVAGCTTRYLDLSLLWTSTEPADRRTAVGAGGSVFPSWSWAGWTGAKQYLIMEDGKRTYRSLHREYSRTEIRRFSAYHQGTVLYIHKTEEEIEATELRNLGSSRSPLKETFPKYVPYSDGLLHGILGPNLGPNVLQFWTQAVDVKRFSIGEVTGPSLTDHEHANITTKQTISKLFDFKNRYCGLIFKPTAKTPHRKKHKGVLQFILISSFGESRGRRTGFQTTDTKMRPFDETKFPRMGKGSGLVNLMLIKWYDEIAERISVARIHRQAWDEARPMTKHIRLA
jgi:hypothetical protein